MREYDRCEHLLRPDLDEVARTVVCIANSREQAGLLVGYVSQLVGRSRLLRGQLREARAYFAATK